MTRENKLAMVVGFGLLLLLAYLSAIISARPKDKEAQILSAPIRRVFELLDRFRLLQSLAQRPSKLLR